MAPLRTIVASISALLLLSLTSFHSFTRAQNVTVVLENAAPVNTNFSTFSRLLALTNVSAEINSRSSLTILVPDNSVLDGFVTANLEGMHLSAVADFCRYHILLQYLDIQEIMQMTNQSGLLITTLYQTTGRAEGIDGFVNMTFGSDVQFGLPPPHATGPVATVLNNFVRYPYNMSFMMLSKPLMPVKLGMKNRPGHYPSIPNALVRGNIYKTFQKLMQDTGVQAAVENLEHQPFTDGVTVFPPTDTAFQNLPSGSLAALSDSQKLSLVQYHFIPGFFTFGSLRTQTAPLPTLATPHESNRFFINASSSPSAGLAVHTGVSSANVIATLMEDDPVGVYAVDAVLLPPEIFPLKSSPPASTTSPPSSSPSTQAPPPQTSTPSSSGAPPPQPASSSTSPPPPEVIPAAPPTPPPGSSSSSSSSGSSSSSSSSGTTADDGSVAAPAEGPLADAKSSARIVKFSLLGAAALVAGVVA